jgi:hypothetical protein
MSQFTSDHRSRTVAGIRDTRAVALVAVLAVCVFGTAPVVAADLPAEPKEGSFSTSEKPALTPAETHRNNIAGVLAYLGQDAALRQAVCATAFVTSFSDESSPAVHDPYELDQDLFKTWIVDNEPVASVESRGGEVTCYNLALLAAKSADLKELAKRAQRGVSITHLREDPDLYRAKIVHLEGILRRLYRFEPRESAKQQGVKDLYEGWILDQRAGRFFVVIMTELPPQIKPGDKLEWTVSFDGYFFKKYGYRAANGDALSAPLLIGRSVVVPTPNDASTHPISSMLYLFMVFVVGVVGMICFLAFWFSRHDHHHRLQIGRALAARRFEIDGDDSPPPPPPVPYAVPLRMTRPPRPEDDSDDKTGFGKATLSPFG